MSDPAMSGQAMTDLHESDFVTVEVSRSDLAAWREGRRGAGLPTHDDNDQILVCLMCDRGADLLRLEHKAERLGGGSA